MVGLSINNMINRISDLLSPSGLVIRGGFTPLPEDNVPLMDGSIETRTVLIVGNFERNMWQSFRASEYCSKDFDKVVLDPLNSWTRDIVEPVADKLSAQAIYPFDGPPYYPFLNWARRAEPVFTSPLGLSIHPEYGLWHAYRAALLFREEITVPIQITDESPCAICVGQPCLSGCPVNAFNKNSYDVPKCFDHLKSNKEVRCMKVGCLARQACPVGADHVYEPEQTQFHMVAFVDSLVKQT